MLFRIIPPELIERQNEIELTLYLKCGSIIVLKGADEPDTLRGTDPYGIIFDEFDTMKYEAWGVVEPIIRANGGWAWFIGTFKGKRHLWLLSQKAVQGHKEWKSWILKASESGVIDPDQLEEAKKSMSQALFNQEFECMPLEGEGAVFRGVREIATAEPERPEAGKLYTMGVDLGKHSDFTVITVYDRSTGRQVYQDRFNKIEWPFQRKRIKEVSTHFNHAVVNIDATGLGDPVADELARAGVAVNPIKITEQLKKDLIEKLSIWIEHKRIRILNINETLFEFDNFTYELTPTGGVRYGAPSGFHDDIIIAHALAVWDLQQVYRDVEDKPVSRIGQRYQELAEQAEGEGIREVYEEYSEWASDY